MTEARLSDGSTIEVFEYGDGPVLLVPEDPRPASGPEAEAARQWGADPELGRSLIAGLDGFRVAAFGYQAHRMAHPADLTPDLVAADFLTVADAVGADRFAYYGYSWLALSGLQLAMRTDRLSALVMGGYPPVDGPYAEMLAVTRATWEMALAGPAAEQSGPAEPGDWDSVDIALSTAQTKQFVTLYEALRDFDDRAVELSCPRMCFAGEKDRIVYAERWGGVTVDIAGPMVRERLELQARGWTVEVLPGLDHMGAMQAAVVLPVVRPWLEAAVSG
ncbi:alpha/beta fold hydrolase [Amycolatopsis benzoatilytica]|uniref:alpha/beta fold hydrolase n=1 Tax=Amycolatopsis benzoatilytica TaxID=346045 RepID=UPI000480D11F|nr:alpha/beta hydrolase [Amycolatopsis benzoatilytica]